MDFLFKKLSDKDKEDVKKQVDSILDSFSKKLSSLRQSMKPLTSSSLTSQTKEKVDESFIERDEFERAEGGKAEELSREIMFENAPDKNKDFIIGEKGKW